MKEYKDALEYFKSAKTLYEEEALNKKIPEVTLNEAKVHLHLEDFKTAKALLENTIVFSQKEQPKYHFV